MDIMFKSLTTKEISKTHPVHCGNLLAFSNCFQTKGWGPNGVQPFVLCPELYDEKVTTGKTGTILCLRSGYKINSFLAIQTLPVFPVVIFSAPA